MKTKKTNRELERIIKGFANHRRLQVLQLLGKKPELSVQEIAERLKSEMKNISAHINKMAIAGLVMKRHEGNMVRHKLSKRGETILKFVRIIE
jgi:DNA-binding transcriptional ArsR family regulator